jgi:hypothetical protein
MPIEVIGVVSDYAAAGFGEQQPGLTRDDMQAMLEQLTGMPLTLDHQHPAYSTPKKRIDKHVTVGKIVKAWIDEIDCLRVKALIDDNVAHTIGADIKTNRLTGFSLGLDNKMRLNKANGDVRHGKGLIECSITPNPEMKLTSFIAGVRDVDASTAAAAISDADASAAASAATTSDNNKMAIDHYELAPAAADAHTTTVAVSASNGERSAALQRVADEVLARVLEAQSDTRAENSKHQSFTSSSSAAAKPSTTAPQRRAAMSRRQQQQSNNNTATNDDDVDDKLAPTQQQQLAQQQQQVQFENRADHDAAIRAGRTYQQPPPRSDVSPVVVNFNGMAPGMMPQFESPGGNAGAHARRNAQRSAFNAQQMAPQHAAQDAQAYQQRMFQKFMQQQEAADQFDNMDGGGANDEGGGGDMSMPPPQPHIAARKAGGGGGGGDSLSDNTLNRKKEAEMQARAEMQFARSTGKFAPSSGDKAEQFAEWLEFVKATKQKSGGKRTSSAAAALVEEDANNRQNPGIDLNAGRTANDAAAAAAAGMFSVDDDDDADTIRMKLALKKKMVAEQKKAAADKELYGMAGSGKKKAAEASVTDDGLDDAPMTEREKKLQRALELERSKASAAAATVASIKGKMNTSAASELAMATDEAGETGRDLDEMINEHKELDTLLERDESNDIKVLKSVQEERDRLKLLKKELIELNKNINNLKGEDQDDEGVRALLEAKLLAKQKKEKTYIDASRKFVQEGTELVRKVSNANKKPTPATIKNKLVSLSNKDNFSAVDLDEVAEKVETVIELVSASHENASVTLAEVKRMTMEAKNNESKMRFELKEKDDLLRRHHLGAASSSAVANRDPFSKAARSQSVLSAAAAAASSSSSSSGGSSDVNGAKKGVPSSGNSSNNNGGKGAFSDLITPEIAARLSEQAPIVGASDGYEGYNSKTMRRAVPLNELTPNDLYGLPYKFIPTAEAKNIKQRAEQCGFTASKDSPFSCFQQQKRSVPLEVKGRGMHVLTGAHMTGDRRVLDLGVKDEIAPGTQPRVTRDMFSNQRSDFNMPNGRAAKLDERFVRLDSDYSRQ